MDSPRLPSPTKYNPKVEERKMRAETDWAKLVRHQQALAEKMIQQEKDMRMLQRMELKDTLTNLAKEKQITQQREQQQAKHEAYVETKERERDYIDYRSKLKNDKNEFQKLISDEYTREKWLKDEEQRKKLEQEKRMDQNIIQQALDSLEMEKIMKEKQKNEFLSGVNNLLNEREQQKQFEKEKAEFNRQEHNYLVNQAMHNVEMKDLNYKLYYQKVMEKQENRQQVHDQRVHQAAVAKDRHLDSFINKNVEEMQRRNDEEERRRQQMRHDQIYNMAGSQKAKIQEHQEQQNREKAAYQEKVDELMRQNKESHDMNNELKMYKNYQAADYKKTLEYQMKEQQDVRRKFYSEMSEHEKKMHLNDFGGRLIPGIKNTTNDLLNFPTIKSKAVERMKYDSLSSPYSPNKGKSFSIMGGETEVLSPAKSAANISLYSPNNNFGRNDGYNPITNPLPSNNQNPYIQKETMNDSPQRRQLRNILASSADITAAGGINTGKYY